jgi:hypothetical protein
MINPDDQRKAAEIHSDEQAAGQRKETTTAEVDSDQRAASQRKDTKTGEIERDDRAASHPGSTAEVAKDLDRSEVSGKPGDGAATLFPEKEANDFRTRWTDIQTGFVDEPRRSVEQADALVAEVMKRLADSFAEERSRLEGQWGRGDDVSTEDLRVALQRYRAFFDRLLNV